MGLFDNLAKTVTVYFKTDGAEEVKSDMDSIALRAEAISRMDLTLKPTINDKHLMGELAAMRLEFRALRMAGERDFSAIADRAREIGDAAATAGVKLAALRLEMSALNNSGDRTGGGDGGGGFFSGLMGNLFGGLAGGGATGAGSGIPVVGGLFGAAGPLVGGATIVAGASALLFVIQQLASAFLAAGAGVAAFAALAYPTFSRILVAAGLTGDRLKDLPAGIRNAARGIQGLEGEFGKMAEKLRPDVFKIFNTGLQIANKLLPYLLPLAKSAATAIEGLLKAFDKYLSSPGFKQFMASLTKLSGPAIAAIGKGLGNVALALMTLFSKLSPWDIVHTINIVFDTISALIRVLGWLLRTARSVWDGVTAVFNNFATQLEGWWGHISHVWDEVQAGINRVISWFARLPTEIMTALRGLPQLLFGLGANAIQGLINGLKSMAGSAISTMFGIAGGIAGAAIHALKIGSPSRVMFDIGVNIGQGLINGLLSTDKKADEAARKIAAIITARIKAAQSYAQSVSSNAIQFAGIAGAVSGPAFSSYVPGHYNAAGNWVAASGTRPTPANRLLRNLGADATRIARFAQAIKRLSNRGLDAALIAQIVAAGPDQGLDIADALLRAPGAIGRADAIERRIQRASASLGAAAAGAQYGGGYYHITINGGISTAHQIALEVEKILKQLRRHRGGRALGL